MTDWQKVQGSQSERPLEFDTTSSKNWVYQRRNIEEIEQENSDGGKIKLWSYEERKLTPDEYESFKTSDLVQQMAQARADIDFLSAMTGNDL